MNILTSIVNYRTPQMVIECLHSLSGQIGEGDRVIVADANSGDESVSMIQQAIEANNFGDWVELLPLDANPGFAAANNAVIEHGTQWLKSNRQRDEHRTADRSQDNWDGVWLLNPDTIVLPGARDALVRELEASPDVGIVGSRLESRDGSPQFASFRFHSAASEFDLHFRWGVVSHWLRKSIVIDDRIDQSHDTEWVSGASMLVRQQVIDDIGPLDDGYFLYYEETDFCLRAHRAGWKCRYTAESRVIHIGGQATGIHLSESRRRPTYWFESRRRYFVKNHGWCYAAFVDGLAIAGLMCWNLRRIVQGKPRQDPPRFLTDLIRNSVFLTGFST